MARNDERTEKPTAKRKGDAKRKGQVAKSVDVGAWLVMLVGSMLVPSLFRKGETTITGLVGLSQNVMVNPTPAGAVSVLEQGLKDVLTLVLPVVCVFAVTGVVANVAQTGLILSLQGAKPKWSHVNPISGFKKLFSTQSLWQLAKQLSKLLVLVGLAYKALTGLGHKLVGSSPVGLTPIAGYSGSVLLHLVRTVSAVGLLLGLIDYGVAKRKLSKSLKMTKQEVKEEARQSEGDPLIKRETRRKMYRMSRARMMAAIAGADVVVVNPTHYAVALRYEASLGRAPRVVAKGIDDVALRIREEGRKHKVPVVEDPPVARAIYAACEIDEPVPAELYLAVARLLAFVFTLPPTVRRAGLVHRRRNSALVA
jgi:flagellar biosynthetic protein FlhB